MADLAALDIPRPDITDRDLAGYWAGTAAGELRVPRTRSGEYVWPPRPSAVGTPDFDLEWVRVPSTGELYTWTVVAQTGLPGYSQITPYAVAVVQLDEVPVRMAAYADFDPAELVAGMRLVAGFVDLGEGVHLLVWRKADE
jgi:uncharacterized protein